MNNTYHGFTAAPASLCNTEHGIGRTTPAGRFDAPIADLSTRQWDGNGGLLSARRLQRKSWLYGAVFSERWLMGCAVIDAGLIGSAFIYVFDRETQQLIEQTALRPLAFDAGFIPTPEHNWAFNSGAKSWLIQPLSASSGWRVQFNSRDWDAEFTLHDTGNRISALNNAPGRPFHYTEKLAGIPASARLRMGSSTHELNAARGVFDFTLGYPPRATLWQWASWVGQLDDGRSLSGNLVAQTMNGLENAVWLGSADGHNTQIIAMPQAIFDDTPTDTAQTWRVHTADQRLSLQFTPEGARSEHINLGVLASDFTQPFGSVRGIWRDEDGSEHTLTGIGVVERHRALW